MKKKITIAALALSLMVATTGCTESMQREFKSLESDFTGGLNRTVTVYSNTGEEIKSWTGKFDVSSSENEVYFDLDGKRVIIQGGIVVNEEG